MNEKDPAEGGRGHEILGELRNAAAKGVGEGARLTGDATNAAKALNLEIVDTTLRGGRALVGHIVGMRLLLPAEGIHGPRETAALVYLFGDALAVRPTDDAPMSAVPLVGLHMVLPQVAIGHWLYKAGRTAHANVELLKDEERFSASLENWTVDDFAAADPKLQVYRTTDLAAPVHLYQHLGLVRLSVPRQGDKPVRLKSSLPEPSSAFVKAWELFDVVTWPGGLSMGLPNGEDEPHLES